MPPADSPRVTVPFPERPVSKILNSLKTACERAAENDSFPAVDDNLMEWQIAAFRKFVTFRRALRRAA